jgi:hypothetical protein
MATKAPDSQTAMPAIDPAAATAYLSSMAQAASTFFQGQVGRWSQATEQMRQGTYDPPRWAKDMVGTLDDWTAWIMVSFQGVSRPQATTTPQRELPTFLFVVDGDVEFVGPMDAPTPFFLPAGVTITMTDLYLIGGDGTGGNPPGVTRSINASAHVQARLSAQGDRVEVNLVDLGRGQSRRTVQGIGPGLYVGAVYAMEVATPRPLAIVYALVKASSVP